MDNFESDNRQNYVNGPLNGKPENTMVIFLTFFCPNSQFFALQLFMIH